MQLFRSDATSLPFEDRKQIAEVTKIGPIVAISVLLSSLADAKGNRPRAIEAGWPA
jgi:hypothetical protein